jgi:putative flippase GtrA
MSRRDLTCILIIGTGVGLLIQPILQNNLSANALAYLTPLARVGILIFFIIFAPFALWIAKLLSRWLAGLYQFAQFAAVGTLNSFIYGGVLNVETFLYGSTIVSNLRFAVFVTVSFLFSTTNSFLWNKYWTFNAREKTNAGEVSGFYGVAFVGWALSVGAATFVKAIGPVGSKLWLNILAPLAGIAVSFAWNFIGYKYWVFKDKNKSSA